MTYGFGAVDDKDLLVSSDQGKVLLFVHSTLDIMEEQLIICPKLKCLFERKKCPGLFLCIFWLRKEIVS